MGTIKCALEPALLFTGILFKDDTIYQETRTRLIEKCGPVLAESEVRDFSFTDYYEKEMGPDLKRVFISFLHLVHPHDLAALKCFTNELEEESSLEGRRRINIDPGYLHLAKVILASTKDYSHRIYLDAGIFAEVTLRFERGSFAALEWTYPDYKDPKTLEFFNHVRKLYFEHLRGTGRTS